MKKILSNLIGVFIAIVSATSYLIGSLTNGTWAANLTFFGFVGLCLSTLIIAYQIGLSMKSKSKP